MKTLNICFLLFSMSLFYSCSEKNFDLKANSADRSSSLAAAITDRSVVGKVICGYQGWFSCRGDGTSVNDWNHWAPGTQPSANNQTFEAYPLTREYNTNSLYLTGYNSLGNGIPAYLFSSNKPDVVDLHFQWMEQNGIDGVALQRFSREILDPRFKTFRNEVAQKVKKAAEDRGRVFYIMYDMSGLAAIDFHTSYEDYRDVIVRDLGITSSDNYALQNGKPVVCIWGLGFQSNDGNLADCQAVVDSFKTAGCYVIGGVQTNWRASTDDSKSGFGDLYHSFDMISPWTVGRYNGVTSANTYKTSYLQPDRDDCNSHNIAYQPVVFPGMRCQIGKAGHHVIRYQE